MLSAAVTLLFALAGMLALASIAHSLREARDAWARLMREGEVLRVGLGAWSAAGEMRRHAPARAAAQPRAVATRRPAGLRPLPLPACAAA